ncbi:unnamed protein product [Amoebophrya sp. A25]|nr:unnamed protein product [Amoebophrya sp. A25]|eukprot:GSA25T00025111001.1
MLHSLSCIAVANPIDLRVYPRTTYTCSEKNPRAGLSPTLPSTILALFPNVIVHPVFYIMKVCLEEAFAYLLFLLSPHSPPLTTRVRHIKLVVHGPLFIVSRLFVIDFRNKVFNCATHFAFHITYIY